MDKTRLATLINNCKQNDRASQEELYRYYYPMMYRVVKKMVTDQHELISIINDGFLKVFQNLDKYDPAVAVFDAWLYTVVTNTAYGHLRKPKNQFPLSSLPNDIEESDKSHLYVISPEDINHLVYSLPDTTGKVLTLSIDGYSHKEISQQLGITEISSRWHLSEARRRVKAILQLKRKMA